MTETARTLFDTPADAPGPDRSTPEAAPRPEDVLRTVFGFDGFPHGAHDAVESSLCPGVPALLHSHSDELLEHRSQGCDLLQLSCAEHGDACSTPRLSLDETFFGENSERFSYGNVAHPEAVGELAFDETFAGSEFSAEDRRAQLLDDTI